MNWQTWLVLALVAGGLAAALVFICKNRGFGGGCGGDCAHCGQACGNPRKKQ